jgi:AIPR protein
MKRTPLTIDDLKAAIRELGERFARFEDDDLFVLWFLRAYVTESEERAAEAIVGGARDKSVDAILVDDAARAVFLVQGKYRKTMNGKNESRSDVVAFAELANVLNGENDDEFRSYLSDMDSAVADRMQAARKKVRTDKYRMWLYFVTTGKVTPTIRKDVANQVWRAGDHSRMEVVDGNRAMLLFRDYLDGVAPPIPTLDLEMEAGSAVTVNGVAQRYDHAANVESWVFSMTGDAIASLYDKAGLRLFARNIRGFMGASTPVNRGMLATLSKEPHRFFYYNNGITILCDEAVKKSSHGRDILQVGNPQVINGQQTTRMLAQSPHQAAKASVLVKVIQVPRDPDGHAATFEELVSSIVQGTNWQNAIKPSDLMSNDRRQIELDRALRKIGYLYLRKRQSKQEALKVSGRGQFHIVTKDEFAQAVAGCEFDPVIIRAGKENLFTEEYYERVFPNTDPNFYLPKYFLLREVKKVARAVPQRGYAIWLVLHFAWSQLSPLIRGTRKSRAFRVLCEKQSQDLVGGLKQSIEEIFVETIKFFRDNRGDGKTAIDISQFFKNRKQHHIAFARHWESVTENRQRTFEKGLARVQGEISVFED